jgi:hypothetical protein
MFDNWINSDLIYINDFLNENGEINQNLILDKLKYKSIFIGNINQFLPNCLKYLYIFDFELLLFVFTFLIP